MKTLPRLLMLTTVILLCLTICSCSTNEKIEKLKSTDLTGVSVNNLSLGSNYEDEIKTKYKPSDKFDITGYSYGYNEFRVKVDDGVVSKINFDLEENDVVLVINGNQNIDNIDDVSNFLGDSFFDEEYDNEQQLDARTYVDDDKKVIFIYNKNDGSLTSVFLGKGNDKIF